MASTDVQPGLSGVSGSMPGVRLPLVRVASACLGAAFIGAAAGGGLLVGSGAGGWQDAAAALACVAAGVVLMLVPLAAFSGRPAVTVASGVMFGGFAGALASAALGAGAYVGLGLEGNGFWFVLLAAALGALVAKLAVVLPALRAVESGVGAAESSGGISGGEASGR